MNLLRTKIIRKYTDAIHRNIDIKTFNQFLNPTTLTSILNSWNFVGCIVLLTHINYLKKEILNIKTYLFLEYSFQYFSNFSAKSSLSNSWESSGISSTYYSRSISKIYTIFFKTHFKRMLISSKYYSINPPES